MAFKFSLQPVLQQRLAQEEKRQREYGEALAKAEAARQRRRQVTENIGHWTREIRQGMAGMTFARRETIERWITAQEGRLPLMDEEVAMLSAAAEQCRARLVRAVQDRTVMEKLREKELKDWRMEEEHAERRFFDELAVRDFASQKRREKDAGSEERIAG